MKFVLITLGFGLMIVTLLSRVRNARWWIRAADFPRLQIAVGLTLVLGGFLFHFDQTGIFDLIFTAGLLVSLGYQCFRIFPYTPIAPLQVRDAVPDDGSRSIRILISNVLMENRQVGDFIALVRDHDPDLVLVMETNDWWDEQLRVLDRDYPNALRQPFDNYYGMNFLSKLELGPAEIRFVVEDDVPSIRAEVRLRSGDMIEFIGLHPRPPEPSQDTEERDAELLIVGREVKARNMPVIVAGDLNDVAWSHTTRLFQRISGLIDPRRGRGMFSTYHAGYPMLRWPLDHVFHDENFTLVCLKRLGHIGSDHFPVLVELKYEPTAKAAQEAPEADSEDNAEAREKIAEAKSFCRGLLQRHFTMTV